MNYVQTRLRNITIGVRLELSLIVFYFIFIYYVNCVRSRYTDNAELPIAQYCLFMHVTWLKATMALNL